jgi:hypothetical protein
MAQCVATPSDSSNPLKSGSLVFGFF